MRGKILVLLVCIAMLVGVLSGCTEEEKTPTPTNNAPTASFTSNVDHNTSTAGGTVTFDSTATDADEDNITYSWDFGDDIGNSSLQNPEYTYAENDTYLVKLTVSDGTEEDSVEDTITVGNIAPTAGFTYVATNLSVVFTDTSTDLNGDDTIVGWAWDFNDDGIIENETQGPVTYVYDTAGTYNVTLIVTDDYDLTGEKTIEVTVTE